MFKIFKNTLIVLGTSSVLLTSCYNPRQKSEPVEGEGTNDNSGVEYAPQMYHSEPYDPMSQITDKEAGLTYWPFEQVGTDESLGGQKHGEWFNSNYWNPHNINMRQPAPNTVRRGDFKYALENSISKDSLSQAAAVLVNPFAEAVKNDPRLFQDCEDYYMRFCEHCHGASGKGDGLVARPTNSDSPAFHGVPNYKSSAIKDKSAGHIYHVITNGKGLMGSHASQLSPEERWKIVTYVQYLQNN